jgi:hypothetical protein
MLERLDEEGRGGCRMAGQRPKDVAATGDSEADSLNMLRERSAVQVAQNNEYRQRNLGTLGTPGSHYLDH